MTAGSWFPVIAFDVIALGALVVIVVHFGARPCRVKWCYFSHDVFLVVVIVGRSLGDKSIIAHDVSIFQAQKTPPERGC